MVCSSSNTNFIETIEESQGSGSNNGENNSNGEHILVLQDLVPDWNISENYHLPLVHVLFQFAMGFHSASQDRLDENGLDFNHSVLATSRLARFHAVSRCMAHDMGVRELPTR